jgi:hypothetical protein
MNVPFFDITKENFLELYANNAQYLLNNKWIHKVGAFKTYNHDDINEFLPYYPEIVDFMRNVFEASKYNYRLFNIPIYRYYTFNADCVSNLTPQYPIAWYETIGIINLFYEHNYKNIYSKKINRKIRELAICIYKQKDFFKTIKALKFLQARILFIFYFILYNLFFIKNEYSNDIKRKVITILGIKLKFKVKNKKLNQNLKR